MDRSSDDTTARLLVLGGTSLIGRYLLDRLAAEGAAAHVVSRKPPESSSRPTRSISWVEADLAEGDLAAKLPSVSAVLSLSPIWLLPQALPALAQAGAQRLVAVSSTSVVTKANSPEASERAVAARLAVGEDATRRFCDAAGIAWTILRPTMIYAEGRDRNVSRLAGVIRRFGILPLAGSGAGLRQPVHADDLAAATLAILDNPATFGRTYELPGGETLTYRAMAERVFEGLGRTPRIFSVPPRLWALALKLASPVVPGATAAMGGRMSQDLSFDPAPARRDFGWSPRPFRPRF